MKNFIIYEGIVFTLEWYYDSGGKSAAYEYFINLSEGRKDKIFFLFQTFADVGKIFNKEKFRSEKDYIFAFKAQPDRFLCFFVQGAKVIITNAFEKRPIKCLHERKKKRLR